LGYDFGGVGYNVETHPPSHTTLKEAGRSPRPFDKVVAGAGTAISQRSLPPRRTRGPSAAASARANATAASKSACGFGLGQGVQA